MPHAKRRASPTPDGAPRDAKRRILERKPCVAWHWPDGKIARKEAVKSWYRVANRVLADERYSYRLMTVIWQFINWETGSLWPTNLTLAEVCGQCDEKTIKRDVAAYERMGLFILEKGWRVVDGRRLRTRTIHLAVPADLQSHRDTRGPYGATPEPDVEKDTRGPKHRDTRGPFTLEDTLEGKTGETINGLF